MSRGQHKQANKHPKSTTRGQRLLAKVGITFRSRSCACGGILGGKANHGVKICVLPRGEAPPEMRW